MKRLLFAAAVCVPCSALSAQTGTKPTTAEAQSLLETRPELVAQLRQRLLSSGLSKEQIHARLKAEGYPEDLLDNYLPGASAAAGTPSNDVFAAVRALGIADSGQVAELQAARLGPTARTATRQTPSSKTVTLSDSGFAVFGLDLFSSATSQFDANLSGPVDANYRLNAGDRLVLIITGQVEESYQLDVTREGFVVVPAVGQIYVANLTLGQVEQIFTGRLARVYSGVAANNQGSTRFSLSVAKLRSNQVIVTGDVQKPGSYLVSSAGTSLSALYAAGGPSANGSLRRIQIQRAGKTIDTLDVYDYLVRGDATHDVRLENGDILFVPPHGSQVRIVGEIVRPATYEMKRNETLADLVRNAGGFRATASRQRVLIERIVPPGVAREQGSDRITLEAGSEALLSSGSAGVAVQNGDVVRVFPIAERVRNRITVAGNVYLQGDQGIVPGEKISDVIRKAGGLRPDTYLGEVLVSRLQSDGTRLVVRSALADTLGRFVNDIGVQEEDIITVFSVTTFRPQRYVEIAGSVNSPGQFPYVEGMTLRDLVLLAKGLAESAYLQEAELARFPEDRTGGKLATTSRVPLDSTYLFERKPNGQYIGPPGLPFPASGAPEVPLRPYDNVLILDQPNWDTLLTVVLQGEVKFPGKYTLKQKQERLSDLIERAGGLTGAAYPLAARFTRYAYGVGRIGIDLPKALDNRESSDNVILIGGDSILIPPFNTVVSVRGAVNQQTSFTYARGRSIDFYINAAGGPALNADVDRAYVIQPGGKIESVHRRFFVRTSTPRPLPGATVIVPLEDPNKKDFVAFASQIGQIIAGLATLIILAKR